MSVLIITILCFVVLILAITAIYLSNELNDTYEDIIVLEKEKDQLQYKNKLLYIEGRKYFAKCCLISKNLKCRTFNTVDEQKEKILDILNNYELSTDDVQINNK